MENETVINATYRRKRPKSDCNNPCFRTEVVSVYKRLMEIKGILEEEQLKDVAEKCGLSKTKNIIKTLTSIFDISRSSVYNLIKENDNASADKENSESNSLVKKVHDNSKYKCDEFTISMIRRIVQEFYANKEYPDVRTILAKCKQNENFPQISESTLSRWMRKYCKMKYRKINKKPVFLERTDIVAQREVYLRNIRKYRQEGYSIYYSDETWASPDQTRQRCWQMLLDDKEYKSLFNNTYSGQVLRDMKNWTGGFLSKSGAGRIIINHIGNSSGFLQGGDDVFISKKDTKDYHGTMNFQRYQEWFEKVLKLVPEKSVLVLDQAPYHRKRVESTINPTTAWRKAQLVSWLINRGVPFPDGIADFNQLTRPELIQLAKEYPLKTKFIVEEMAENCGKDVKVLWLPVAHCEFNAIELIWAAVKHHIAKYNTGKTLKEMFELTKQALATITPELWKNCVDHVIKYEERMWERDRLMEDDIFESGSSEKILIRVQDDGDTSSSSDSEYDDN